MPINQQLLSEISLELGNSTTPSLTTLNNACDLYEAYVFALALQAGRAEGFSVAYFDRDGNTTNTFTFRTSPSAIFKNSPLYCHAELTSANKPSLELHQGVYVAGTSTAKHECDVSLIWRIEAEAARQGRKHPEHKKVIAAAECKLYQTSPLKIGLGRAFVGLAVDLKGVNCAFVSDQQLNSIEKIVKKHKRVITRGKRGTFWKVTPSNAPAVKDLVDNFRQIFIDFLLNN